MTVLLMKDHMERQYLFFLIDMSNLCTGMDQFAGKNNYSNPNNSFDGKCTLQNPLLSLLKLMYYGKLIMGKK